MATGEDITQDERELGQWDADQAAAEVNMYRQQQDRLNALARARDIVTELYEAESWLVRAERQADGSNAQAYRQRVADAVLRGRGESPSVARLRAALILLAGINDETLTYAVARDIDHLRDAR